MPLDREWRATYANDSSLMKAYLITPRVVPECAHFHLHF